MALMWFLMSDKQPKIKVLISPFYSYVEYLNIRLAFSFEHTDWHFYTISPYEGLFQTKKSDCFLEPDFKRKRVSDIL
jgi:hypothetical protein